MGKTKGLTQRLADGEDIICAEGYLFEFEQRGYLKAGAFVPEVVIEHPDAVRNLHKEFVHAGSDVVEAFTYYGHRAKLDVIGREDDLEHLNRTALRLAREVADETGTLLAGNICNTTVYDLSNEKAKEDVRGIFKEQIEWAVEEGADFIIGETYWIYEEAMLALKCIQEYGKGLPSVVNVVPWGTDMRLSDGVHVRDACKNLEEAGATIVGLNCSRGPATILPLLEEVRKSTKGPLACLPVPYRTTDSHPRMQDLRDTITGENSFPGNLNPWLCSRWDIADFTKKAKSLGVRFFGLCCGGQAHYIRTMAETLGRSPPASKYSPDMTQHFSQVKDKKYSSKFEQDQYNKQLEAVRAAASK